MHAVASYSYTAANPRELSVKKGDKLTIIDAPESKKWWKVRNEAGQEGFVPSNYLQLKDKKPAPAPVISGPTLISAPPAVAELAAPLPIPVGDASSSQSGSASPKTSAAPASSASAAPASKAQASAANLPGKRVRVIYNYKAQRADELSLSPGDVLVVLDEKADGWSKGTKLADSATGWFPAMFTEEMPPEASTDQSSTATSASQPSSARAPAAPAQSTPNTMGKDSSMFSIDGSDSAIVCCCTSMYKYVPTQESELGLEVGDVIWILEKSNDIWWRARNYYGVVGFAPVSYLREEVDAQPTSVQTTTTMPAPQLSMRVQSQASSAPSGASQDVSSLPGYQPTMTREQAEAILPKTGVLGMYLIRSSPTHFSLSVNVGRHAEHFKITMEKPNSFVFGDRTFDSIAAIIEYYKTNAIFTLLDKTIITLQVPYQGSSR